MPVNIARAQPTFKTGKSLQENSDGIYRGTFLQTNMCITHRLPDYR